MNRRDHFICRRGDDGKRLHLAAWRCFVQIIKLKFAGLGRSNPFLVNPGETKKRIVPHREPEWRQLPLLPLPLVKSIGRNQTALPFHRLAKARFLRNGFRPRVNQFVADTFVLGPGRNEAPAHEFQNRPELVEDDNGGLLARGDVVTRGEKGDPADEIKEPGKFGQIFCDCKAGTHNKLAES